MPRRPVIITAALEEELAPLRALESAEVRLLKTGVGPARAARAARRVSGEGRLIISTGCCGGLVPGAMPGMLAIPDEVLHEERGGFKPAPPPDGGQAALARSLAEQMGLHCSGRPLVSVSRALSTPADKRRCHEQCGAVAVDMETAAIAVVAAESDTPLLSVRVVLDSVDDHLPDLSLTGENGKLRPARLVRALRRPRSLVTLASLKVRLRRVSGSLGRFLGAVLDCQ